MAPWKATIGSREAFDAARPYARDGVRITVFYDAIHEGTRGRYQVNFRLSTDTAKGSVAVEVRAAGVAGTPVKVMVQ